MSSLKDWLKFKKIEQKDLAARWNINPVTLSSYVTGRYDMPTEVKAKFSGMEYSGPWPWDERRAAIERAANVGPQGATGIGVFNYPGISPPSRPNMGIPNVTLKTPINPERPIELTADHWKQAVIQVEGLLRAQDREMLPEDKAEIIYEAAQEIAAPSFYDPEEGDLKTYLLGYIRGQVAMVLRRRSENPPPS